MANGGTGPGMRVRRPLPLAVTGLDVATRQYQGGLVLPGTPSILLLQVKGGVEVQISKMVDFYVHVPLTVGLGGGSTPTFHEGGTAVDAETGEPAIRTAQDQPPGASLIGGGLLLGLQVKLFGPKFK